MPHSRKKALVLFDRDGVLNVDRGYVHRPADLTFTPDAPEAIRSLNGLGVLVAVVTNQSGIGRGYFDEAAFHAFMAHMGTLLSEKGAHIDDVRFCPNHPDEGIGAYRVDCGRRKPGPGMLLEAMAHLDADPALTVMIGDNDSDLEAAAAAGVRGVRYEGGSLLELVRRVAPLSPRGERDPG